MKLYFHCIHGVQKNNNGNTIKKHLKINIQIHLCMFRFCLKIYVEPAAYEHTLTTQCIEAIYTRS